MRRTDSHGRPARRLLGRFVAGLSLGVCLGLPSAAWAQSLKLRVADSFPVGHFVPEYLTKFFMSEVTKNSNKSIEFEYYPAEQLGKAKDMLTLVQTGVADITYVAPAYIADKLPLSGVVELPGNFSSSCVGTRAYWSIAKPGGLLDKREFATLGVRVLFTLMFPPNQIVLSKPRFEGLKTLEGLKIRTSGGAKDQMLRRINAVPIQMAAPEIYEAMSRGTIDGLMIPVASLPPYELDKLSKVATIGENFGAFIVTYAMAESRWQKLTPAQQKVLADAGEAATARACQLMENDDAKNYDNLKAKGVNLVRLSPEDKQVIGTIGAAVARDWAEQMDRRGKTGTEVLRAFEGAVK
jgi:TRAP-type C4-dicarboxylate transport system substrate-binding protein